MKKKKVLVLAYTNVNLGDDLFVRVLCQRYPEVSFYIEANQQYQKIFQNIPNLVVLNRHTHFGYGCVSLFHRIARKLFHTKNVRKWYIRENYDAVVYVIGSLFDEDINWERCMEHMSFDEYANAMWKDSLVDGVPFFLLSSNMTRVESDQYIKCIDVCLSQLEDVCFRDRFSYEKFSHLPNVRYAPDLVLNGKIPQNKIDTNKVTISVWGIPTQCDHFPQWEKARNQWEAYRDLMREVIRASLQRGKKVELLALCEDEGDLEGCKQILAEQPYEQEVSVYTYSGNFEEVIQKIAESELVIGTRFHSVILSFCAKRPVFPVVYESKTLQLLKDIEYSGTYLEYDKIDPSQNSRIVDAVFNAPIISNDDYISRAAEQFLKLDKLLRE